jgi:hypothetical protein
MPMSPFYDPKWEPTVDVTIRMPVALHRRIREAAERNNETISRWMRRQIGDL